jgi:hypothetical protein
LDVTKMGKYPTGPIPDRCFMSAATDSSMSQELAVHLLTSGRKGVARWNAWWKGHYRRTRPAFDLGGVNLAKAHLEEAFLFGVDLRGAMLRGANLHKANLNGALLDLADLMDANLMRASLNQAALKGARLDRAELYAANLRLADLTGADLRGASLQHASLARSRFVNARLDGCRVYGVSSWEVNLKGASQKGLVITPPGRPEITVDNLKLAQFIFLLLNNAEIRDVIDTITSKVVLILGRFTATRKRVLDALRESLRERGYSPVLFDFEKPGSRTYRETVSTLAHMSRFVIADLTDAKVVLQELEVIVKALPSVPVQPILQSRARASVVVPEDYGAYPWFLPPVRYRGAEDVTGGPLEEMVGAAEAMALSRRCPTGPAVAQGPPTPSRSGGRSEGARPSRASKRGVV